MEVPEVLLGAMGNLLDGGRPEEPVAMMPDRPGVPNLAPAAFNTVREPGVPRHTCSREGYSEGVFSLLVRCLKGSYVSSPRVRSRQRRRELGHERESRAR
jgi:hypothetical protein